MVFVECLVKSSCQRFFPQRSSKVIRIESPIFEIHKHVIKTKRKIQLRQASSLKPQASRGYIGPFIKKVLFYIVLRAYKQESPYDSGSQKIDKLDGERAHLRLEAFGCIAISCI